MADGADPKSVLAEILGDRPDLASAAAAIFDYTQYLLDDDERLTKSGALDGAGRDLVRTRTLEMLGGPVGPEPELEDELAGADDDDDDDAGDDGDGDDGDDENDDGDDDDEDDDDDDEDDEP